MSIKNKKESSHKFKLIWINKGTIGNSRKGRRSGEERRKGQSKKYLSDGKDEIKSWAKRRNRWEQTI